MSLINWHYVYRATDSNGSARLCSIDTSNEKRGWWWWWWQLIGINDVDADVKIRSIVESNRTRFRGKALSKVKKIRGSPFRERDCFPFFSFFFFFSDSNFFQGTTLHPSDISKCKFFNVFFPVFEVVRIWLEIFSFFSLFSNIIYAFGLGAIFSFEVERFFLLVYFVNLIFGNIVFFFSLSFFFVLFPHRSYWILNFGTEKILFCFFLYYHIYVCLIT